MHCCCDTECNSSWIKEWQDAKPSQCIAQKQKGSLLCQYKNNQPSLNKAGIFSKTPINYVGENSILCIKKANVPTMSYYYDID
jgi:hypothetical protein